MICAAFLLPPLLFAAATDNPVATLHEAAPPLAPDAQVQDWPWFAGPTHDGVCRETFLLEKWPAGGPKLLWEMAKGSGYSSPSVAGDLLVYFHRVGDEEVVLCLDAETGVRRWRFAYPTRYRDRYGYSNGPRATPVIEARRVTTLGAEGMLHCLDIDSGKQFWTRNLQRDFRQPSGFFGVTASPLLEGGLLIVNVGAPQADDGACVVAFDKLTGETRWQSGNQWGASYASPMPATIHGQRRILIFAGGESKPPSGGLICLDPSDGRIDFRFPWRSRTFESVNASTPIVAGNRVFVTASYKTGGALVEVSEDLAHRAAWTTDKLASHFSTVHHRDDHLYGIDGRHANQTALVCLEMRTGRQVWRHEPKWQETYRTEGMDRRADFGIGRAALLRVGDRFLCLGETGHLLQLKLTPDTHEITQRAWLFAAADSWTPPVISRGLLYVVQNKRDFVTGEGPRLLCYSLRGE